MAPCDNVRRNDRPPRYERVPSKQFEQENQRVDDDDVAESLFGSLKKARIKKHIYKNRELAVADMSFYNRPRRHSHLSGMSPEQFEAEFKRRPRGLQ